MFTNDAARRTFLRVAGLGMSGVAVGAMTRSAVAKSTPTSGGEYDVRTFGAKGDGKTVDTPAINKAIDAAAAAGGGTVLFRAGSYLCYSIHLKSNVGLYLDHGATIVAADTPVGGKRRLRRGGAESVGPISGLRPQPLAQQFDLGRGTQEYFDCRAGTYLGQRPEQRQRK